MLLFTTHDYWNIIRRMYITYTIIHVSPRDRTATFDYERGFCIFFLSVFFRSNYFLSLRWYSHNEKKTRFFTIIIIADGKKNLFFFFYFLEIDLRESIYDFPDVRLPKRAVSRVITSLHTHIHA